MLYPAVEDVVVGAAVRLQRADVLPIALDDVSDQLQAAVQHRRKDIAREVDDLAFGDEVEDLGFEHVDVGVDGVGEHLAPGRLLQEALDRAVLASDDDAELHGILDPLEGDRRERLARLVRLHDLAEVDVGQGVARDHEERLVELLHGVAHRSGGAERGLLRRVAHADTEVGAVAEIVANVVREERDRHHDVVEAVLREQPDDVLHHRRVRDGHHRLRLIAREGPEPGAFSPGEDHRLHTCTSAPTRAARPSRNAALAAGTYRAAA